MPLVPCRGTIFLLLVLLSAAVGGNRGVWLRCTKRRAPALCRPRLPGADFMLKLFLQQLSSVAPASVMRVKCPRISQKPSRHGTKVNVGHA